jgi:hypothetical protein
MVFLRDEETATRWAEEEDGSRDVFDLSDAIEFAAAFFRPLLDS